MDFYLEEQIVFYKIIESIELSDPDQLDVSDDIISIEKQDVGVFLINKHFTTQQIWLS